jgi:hypothetical protein
MYLGGITQLINAVGQAINAVTRRQTEDYIKELEKRRDEQFRIWDEEMQRRLYDMGFIEAQSEEQHQRELELAIESGDQQRIFQAHSNHEKFKIEEEYAQKQKALDEDMAKKKAGAEYRAALATWQVQCAQAAASVAQSIIMASVNAWPVPAIPMMALATATGAAQIASLKASKPPAFTTGGIVPGNLFKGDKILALVNSGEMVLNQQQQQNLFNALNSGGLGGNNKEIKITVHLTNVLDGKAIGENTVELINNRQLLIDSGSVV